MAKNEAKTKRQTYDFTPEQDERIALALQDRDVTADELADEFGMPKGVVQRRGNAIRKEMAAEGIELGKFKPKTKQRNPIDAQALADRLRGTASDGEFAAEASDGDNPY